MAKGLLIASIIIICWTVLGGCRDTSNQQSGPSSRAASADFQGVPPKAEPDEISGKWSWATPAIPAAPTLQIATITRSGDSLVGQVAWLLDGDPSAEVSNGKTDGTKVSFDATFVLREAKPRNVRIEFSYSGTLHKANGNRISGTCRITGNKDGTPVTLEYPWNAFPEP